MPSQRPLVKGGAGACSQLWYRSERHRASPPAPLRRAVARLHSQPGRPGNRSEVRHFITRDKSLFTAGDTRLAALANSRWNRTRWRSRQSTPPYFGTPSQAAEARIRRRASGPGLMRRSTTACHRRPTAHACAFNGAGGGEGPRRHDGGEAARRPGRTAAQTDAAPGDACARADRDGTGNTGRRGGAARR